MQRQILLDAAADAAADTAAAPIWDNQQHPQRRLLTPLLVSRQHHIEHPLPHLLQFGAAAAAAADATSAATAAAADDAPEEMLRQHLLIFASVQQKQKILRASGVERIPGSESSPTRGLQGL